MNTEATYAPPFQAREFFANKMAFTTGPAELYHRIKSGHDIVIVDVREPKDFQKGHLPGAINIPKAQWTTAKGFKNDTLNVLYGYSGVCDLVANAAVHWAVQGFRMMEMHGGFESWKENKLPIET